MADRFLHGNGRPCPRCNGLGRVSKPLGACVYRVRCAPCAGSGRVALTQAQIVAAQIAEHRAKKKARQAGR